MSALKPLVSVIMPMYNAERYIEDALGSIMNQSYPNLEIIIVDDGSTDSSASIVNLLITTDDRIKIFHQKNQGQCSASNYGFSKSQGKYIKFFDADDILSLNVIENQVAALEGKQNVDASYMDYTRFYNNDISTIDTKIRPALINYDCSPEEYILFHGSPQMYQCSIWLFDREIFSYSGLWDERLSLINDTEFFPRVLKYVDRLYYAPGCNLFYRTNAGSGSLSQIVSSKSMKSALLSVDLMAMHTRSFISSNVMERIIAQSYIEILEMSYPSQPKWTRIIERRLKQFKPTQYHFVPSGRVYNYILKIFGWRIAKQFQSIYYHLCYSKKSNNS